MNILTDRLKRLKLRLHEIDYKQEKKPYFYGIDILKEKEGSFLKKESIVVRKAYAVKYIAEHLPVHIKDDELVVGCPDINSETIGKCVPKYLTQEERELFAKYYYMNELTIYGHHPPGYEKIIQKGIVGLKKDVQKKLLQLAYKEPSNVEMLDEYRAMLISLDSVVIYAKRYADQILKVAFSCEDERRKNELLHMYQICNSVPFYPATSLQEAVQAFWFTYTILNSAGELIPLGRIDQYFYNYYKNDLHLGKINQEMAMDIMGSFLIKLNEKVVVDVQHNKMKCYDYQFKETEYVYNPLENQNSEHNYCFGQAANHTLMTAVVGGVGPDGHDATNELSYMIIELVFQMNLLLPILGARIHTETSDKFLELLAKVLSDSQGEPIIYNDKNIIEGYVRLGVPLEDARNYSSDGCWETLIPGKTNFFHLDVYLLLCLEHVFNRGKSLKKGIIGGGDKSSEYGIDLGVLSAFKTFEMFYLALKKQMYYQMDFLFDSAKGMFGMNALSAPDPLFSAITDDCIETGQDVYAGGARYNIRMLVLAGLADTVDALNAIKRVVYDEKMISLEELNNALHANWQGYERIRAYILNKIPKFGNDTHADDIAERLIRDFSVKLKKIRELDQGFMWTGGIGTFFGYAQIGRNISASANGRYNFEPIAPNYSPVPGFDKNGPTSIIKSITKPDLKELFGGTPVDISLNKNEISGESGRKRLMSLIKSFCALGGDIMTITSASVDELKDAKLHPEKYQNLRVRIGGLSAYFISLSPAQQDTIISRFGK